MGEVTHNNLIHRIAILLLFITIVGTALLPAFNIYHQIPAIEISDVTFPILFAIGLFGLKSDLIRTIQQEKQIVIAFGVFLFFVMFSMVWNSRLGVMRDWFEFLKYFKFFFFFILTVSICSIHSLRKLLVSVFIAVFLFNILHYFNLFNFNDIIEPFYSPPHHLDFFGLNSIGEPATKRALGTLGNPNTNGILFLLFIVLFLPRKKTINWLGYTVLFLAILGLFMCQTRTGTLAYVLVLLTYFITMKRNLKTISILLTMSIVSFFLLQIMGNFYLDTLANAEVMQRVGRGRLEQWIKIIELMPGYWLFGHAPNKELFESNAIYSESEYFLILFRYGIIGLFAFLIFWFFWFKNYAIRAHKKYNLALYLVITYLVCAFTNNPLQSPKIALFLAIVMAVSILGKNERTEETT